MKRQIAIYDTTLRDGAQGAGISYSVNDKLQIVKALDHFGVDYIEAGNPGSNPKDLAFFHAVASQTLEHAQLCAFGSTLHSGLTPQTDENLQALLRASTPIICIFGKAWDFHVNAVLGISLEENLELVDETIRYLKQQGRQVFFDAEHYFDGCMRNPQYAKRVLQTALAAGADALVLCDTNGATMPGDISAQTALVRQQFPDATLGIHCHNDTGCATANSLLAVAAGVSQVQGTLIGIGERCGNADLSAILPSIALKYQHEIRPDLGKLFQVARQVADISNTRIENSRPYIGMNAFAHKGGMHIDGVLKEHASFEHIDPEAVGNKRRFLVSEVAGRSTVVEKIRSIRPDLGKDSAEVTKILARLKEMELFGYQFEAADASFALLVQRTLGTFQAHFDVILYKTMGEYPAPDNDSPSTAIIQLAVDGKEETTAALGKGPVNALDLALRKALTVFYPEIRGIRLSDYKVRVLEQNMATAAKVRVLIETRDAESSWTTIGVSDDIIEASLLALMDSMEYKLSGKARIH